MSLGNTEGVKYNWLHNSSLLYICVHTNKHTHTIRYGVQPAKENNCACSSHTWNIEKAAGIWLSVFFLNSRNTMRERKNEIINGSLHMQPILSLLYSAEKPIGSSGIITAGLFCRKSNASTWSEIHRDPVRTSASVFRWAAASMRGGKQTN